MIDHGELLRIYRRMLRIRAFETRVSELCAEGELSGPLHLSIGMEATAVGACAPLTERDIATSTCRPHGHLLARDVPMRALMAELFGRATGINGGRAGSARSSAVEQGLLGAAGAPGAGLLLAAGAALGARLIGPDRIALAFFGEECVTTGAFHEGATLAVTLSLPMVLVCENALYAGTRQTDVLTGHEDLVALARGYGLPGVSVDGNDVLAVRAAVEEAALRARSGSGSTLIEARGYRWSPPSESHPVEQRDAAGIREWQERDPIPRYIAYLDAHRVAEERELLSIAREVDGELTEAVEFARSSAFPSLEQALADVDAAVESGVPSGEQR